MANPEIYELAVVAMEEKGVSDARKLAARAISGEADGTELTASQDTIPTWRQRDYSSVPIGTPYKWQGVVYKLWQQHDATNQPDWTPDAAVSLWDICHTTDPAMAKPYVQPQGTRGMYQPGEVCTENGHVWKCTQTNTVYPPSQLPGAWEDLGEMSGETE